MTVELLLSLFGALAALVSGAWLLIKFAARQFDERLDERFKAQEKIRQQARMEYARRFEQLELSERDFRKFQTDVHRDFVRRDDYVRDIASIKVMIDNLGLNVEKKLTEIWQEMRGRQ